MFLQGVSGIQVADCKDLFPQYIKSDDEYEKKFCDFYYYSIFCKQASTDVSPKLFVCEFDLCHFNLIFILTCEE